MPEAAKLSACFTEENRYLLRVNVDGRFVVSWLDGLH